MLRKTLVVFCMLLALAVSGFAQETAPADTAKDTGPYQFSMDYEIAHSPVRNQARTGTCWCFSTISMLESELIRMGWEEIDLSEMFIVRKTYPLRARSYVRLHGDNIFAQGAYSHDVINQMRIYGMMPESAYSGMNIGEKRHNHGEIVSMLRGMLDAVIKRRGGKLTPRWEEAFEGVLDSYFGEVPETFQYEGKTYTPKSYLEDYLKLNPDDYIEITSFTHHPFYSQCYLEVPDNWCHYSEFYNVPLADLERICDNALKTGYSFVWGGDVSDRFFRSSKEGYAVVPQKDWEDMTRKEREQDVTEPIQEKTITQEMRQKDFDNFTTTDDHAMHVIGLAHDQTGAPFYLVKNSWGTDMKYEGRFYMSKPYFLLRGVAIMINKNALPEDIKQKLNIQ